MTLGAYSEFMCNVALRMSTQPQVPTKNRNNNTKQATIKKKNNIQVITSKMKKSIYQPIRNQIYEIFVVCGACICAKNAIVLAVVFAEAARFYFSAERVWLTRAHSF